MSLQKKTFFFSFQGSGNTWLRYLLQQATGIFTGSVYKDFGLLKSGFPAENVCNASVLLVKTHEVCMSGSQTISNSKKTFFISFSSQWGPNAWKLFSRAILLVRDPDQSILAEFNRFISIYAHHSSTRHE